jgi:precorrin-3B C17-methyltransferase
MEECHTGLGQGKLYVVGTGPGGREHLTPAACAAITAADCIVGYRTYLDLIPELLAGKEVLASEMMKEVDRCRQALAAAAAGRTVALVSGGDPGIYAMAGLALEMLREHGGGVAVEVIPGIAALNACAARLGAPLMHDFAAISLSDLLTPWETIEKRLRAAAAADFVIVIYNPRSKRRTEQIVKAREIILAERPVETPVGIVTAATRENERVELTTLGEMLACEIGMQSTLVVGNSQTYAWRNLLITPRGYQSKYEIGGA